MHAGCEVSKSRVDAALEMIGNSAVHSAGIRPHGLLHILVLVGQVWILFLVRPAIISIKSYNFR